MSSLCAGIRLRAVPLHWTHPLPLEGCGSRKGRNAPVAQQTHSSIPTVAAHAGKPSRHAPPPPDNKIALEQGPGSNGASTARARSSTAGMAYRIRARHPEARRSTSDRRERREDIRNSETHKACAPPPQKKKRAASLTSDRGWADGARMPEAWREHHRALQTPIRRGFTLYYDTLQLEVAQEG